MYENYLINSAAICKVINESDSESTTPITLAIVENWLKTKGAKPEYFSPAAEISSYGEEKWFEEVHAGKVLKALFGELTDNRVSYNKVQHGARLTQLLSEAPDRGLTDLANFLASVLPTN